MIGVVLISHGDMAKGIISSAEMIYPDGRQVETISLYPDTNPDIFQQELQGKIKDVDSGDGVIVLADLLGGTPCNRAVYCMGEKVKLVSGVNLPMYFSVLACREDIQNLDELVVAITEDAKNGIIYVNSLLGQQEENDG